MKPEPNLIADQFRTKHPALPFVGLPGSNQGFFRLPVENLMNTEYLNVISAGDPADNPTDWEHVSVSVAGGERAPTWQEMCEVKNMFWTEDETVVQFHPKADSYINKTPLVLHLWKNTKGDFLLPPKEMV